MKALAESLPQGAAVRTLAGTVARNAALDFTKGALVLLMILYHWINYFVSTEGAFYKYLRFITPSFIFIAGFLIANVYLTKYRIGDPRLHLRLLTRGVKLLAVFTILNVAGNLVMAPGAGTKGAGLSSFIQNAGAIYIGGDGSAAMFPVLVPISYVLILSSGLLLPCKWFKPFLPFLCATLFLGIFILGQWGLYSANLELFSIGMLGMVIGVIPINRIDELAAHPFVLLLSYAGYLVALTIWNEIYALQVVGVCLSLSLIYVLGIRMGEQAFGSAWVQLLGRYSLLAYIAQIAVLVVLYAIVQRIPLGDFSRLASTFLTVLGLTAAIVKWVDVARGKWRPIDTMYRAVFA